MKKYRFLYSSCKVLLHMLIRIFHKLEPKQDKKRHQNLRHISDKFSLHFERVWRPFWRSKIQTKCQKSISKMYPKILDLWGGSGAQNDNAKNNKKQTIIKKAKSHKRPGHAVARSAVADKLSLCLNQFRFPLYFDTSLS